MSTAIVRSTTTRFKDNPSATPPYTLPTPPSLPFTLFTYGTDVPVSGVKTPVSRGKVTRVGLLGWGRLV